MPPDASSIPMPNSHEPWPTSLRSHPNGAVNPPPTGFPSPGRHKDISISTSVSWMAKDCRELDSLGEGPSSSVLTLGPISCLDAHEFRDEYLCAKADQDAEALRGKSCKPILEANTRQRDAPPGAFWLCAFAWRPGANALPLGSNEPRSKEARCLNPFRSALAPS